MSKYNVNFCRCGRVHFIEWEKINKVCSDKTKSLLHICNNCGHVLDIWFTDYEDGYAINSKSVLNEELEVKNIGLVVTSTGTKIYMKTGNEATMLEGGTFIDWGTSDRGCKEEDRYEVDIHKTLRYLDDEIKAKELSGYGVNIDWSGTKYATSYNSKKEKSR